MVKRIASQVHKQASRLLRQRYIKKEPAWFQAVLDHPPLPLPAKAPPPRTPYDVSINDIKHADGYTAPSKKGTQSTQPRPIEIHYVEDQFRRQFFQDHPFEAFRPVSLIEGRTIADEHPIRGVEWKRLRQRGRNPSPEDAIRYAVNLHEHHNLSLINAYSATVAQFRSLRAEHHISSAISLLEAESYGISFGPSQVDIVFDKEEKALQTWMGKNNLDAQALAARKRWKAIIERTAAVSAWTRGQEYTRLWKEGVRPDYSPVLTSPDSSAFEPVEAESKVVKQTPHSEQQAQAQQIDFLGLDARIEALHGRM